MNLSKDIITNVLRNVIDPDLGKDLVSLGMIADLKIEESTQKISFTLNLTTPACPLKEKLKNDCISEIKKACGEDATIEIIFGTLPRIHTPKAKESILPDVGHIVLVASGKGGVGKSTVAANLAIELAKNGARVGLVDADIYGPSVPIMFQLEGEKPGAMQENGKQYLLPFEKYGIKLISIGFFVEPEKALIWRGPMASNALKQLFTDVYWGELDYLIVDTPPGTGDIHLTLVQSLTVSGVAIVTTPQNISLTDARKAINMYRAEGINVPVLGLIENMSFFTPAELPENKYYIFGQNGGQKLAQEMKTEFLGQIPLVQSICESGDKGTPFILQSDSIEKEYFAAITANLTRQLSIWDEYHKISDINPHDENCDCKKH